jgi:hypothetical protein
LNQYSSLIHGFKNGLCIHDRYKVTPLLKPKKGGMKMKGQHIFLAEGNALKKDFKDAFSLVKRMIDNTEKSSFNRCRVVSWMLH